MLSGVLTGRPVCQIGEIAGAAIPGRTRAALKIEENVPESVQSNSTVFTRELEFGITENNVISGIAELREEAPVTKGEDIRTDMPNPE